MKTINKIGLGIIVFFFMALCFWTWLKPQDMYSKVERRNLKQFPELTLETLFSGRFMNEFESYALDQFPMRNELRSLKAVTSLKKDNNDIYVVDGVINSMEYPLNEDSLAYAATKFEKIYEQYLKENQNPVYFSIIPDKNYFFAEKNGYLALDYEKMVAALRQKTDAFMTYIDIFELLSGEDYYKTDTHWRQEKLLPVAECLLEAVFAGNRQNGADIDEENKDIIMENLDTAKETINTVLKNTDMETEAADTVFGNYQMNTLDNDFYGVYYGQAALPVKPDKISYLTNAVIENYEVFDHEHQKKIDVYEMEKAKGDDPYEMFLGGPLSLVTIENPANSNGRELIIFRDSFGSSIAPLLAQEYAKTTLIDIRYLQSALLGKFVDFQNADVLFLYSSSVLNNSNTLK